VLRPLVRYAGISYNFGGSEVGVGWKSGDGELVGGGDLRNTEDYETNAREHIKRKDTK